MDYYEDDVLEHAINIFGPFMHEWEYDFPKNWPKKNVSYIQRKTYDLIKYLRYIYSKYVLGGPLRSVRFLREIVS